MSVVRWANDVLARLLSGHPWAFLPSVLVGSAVGSACVIVFAPVRGVPGVCGILIAGVVATQAGPRAGVVVALVTGSVFWLRLGEGQGRNGLLAAVPLWALLAVLTGASAAKLRDAAAEQSRHAAEMQHRALHDPLTGLANRALVLDRLGRALLRSARRRTNVGVLFLDLDHFKVVNDSLGHTVGDDLLGQVADRLQTLLRSEDTAGRVGGDEFVIVCEDLEDDAEAVVIADRVRAAMTDPFSVEGHEVVCPASVGIALSSSGAQQPEELIRDADLAMYSAKRRGGSRVHVFDETLRVRATSRLETEIALRRAISHDELLLYYQPITDLETGLVTGVEALLRWSDPQRGMLEPDAFLSVAEDSGLIVPIGHWVLQEACAQLARWRTELRTPLTMAVNVSQRQLVEGSFADLVSTVLSRTGASAGDMRLEVTETVLLGMSPPITEELARLEQAGVSIGLDDFGTGYSSLTHLRRFPVRFLKIDKSFVTGLHRSRDDAAIVGAVVHLGRTMDLDVIAEGIETRRQLDAVRGLGCRLGQGFHLGEPQDPQAIGRLLHAQGTG